ncbi:uncharacterized protein BX664DRAFT_323995 [Halteromyces radiatus]|uniref:uncharacterized protein n=1 Tax=Halteromyces radiatus TaxID=101107 RepID=UPI00221E9C80|nr:uncharacterized protein BX664DRAFT_323995 [Halteromyces radiatus]KAI8096437.1 hypothetical protein BX664DRAFT_323995 [Halteromyces radiatus]
MHFVFQALHRRPLEPRSLAIARGVSAVLLALAFLAYLGYLIYQIYTDKRLLIISTTHLQSYPSPDVEMCVYGSPFEITSCALIDMEYNSQVVPGCTPYLTGSPADNPGPQWCRVFKTDQLIFGVDTPSQQQPNVKTIRRVDIYWAISNLTAFNQVNPWAPSVTVTLYSPQFSTWRLSPDDLTRMIPQQQTAWRNLQLQHYVSTTIMNYWSTIYFSPARYRAIRPYDPLSIFGMNSSFVDIDTLQTSQHDWPLNNANLNYAKFGNYQGEFSFMLTAGDMEVRTEQRQHTVLAALALSGGAYGVIFAIYCVLYGTPKLTPFGFTHGMSIWYYRGRTKLGRKKTDEQPVVQHENNSRNSKYPLIPMDHISVQSDNSSNNSLQDLTSTDHISIPTEHPTTENDRKSSQPRLQYFAHLESRVHELESILREYFLDVDYLDALRQRQDSSSTADHTQSITSFGHDFLPLAPTETRKSITGQDWQRTK